MKHCIHARAARATPQLRHQDSTEAVCAVRPSPAAGRIVLAHHARGESVLQARIARTAAFARDPHSGFMRAAFMAEWFIRTLDALPMLPGRESVYRDSLARALVGGCLVDLRRAYTDAAIRIKPWQGQDTDEDIARSIAPTFFRSCTSRFADVVHTRVTDAGIPREISAEALRYVEYLLEAWRALTELPDGNQEYFADPLDTIVESALSALHDEFTQN